MLHNVQVVGAYNDLCGECPVWDAGDSALYWTDCSGRRFHRLDPDSGIHSEVATSRAINGFRLNEPGGFVVSSGDGIWQWSGDEEFSLLCSQVQGAKCQMNDCVADPFGGLIAGSQFYDSSGCYEMGKLMRVRPHGRPEILDEGFHLSNGLAFSPDCKTLYFADSVGRHIYSYDFDLGTGSVSRRRTFVKVPDTDGLPDGLSVDQEGFVWSAQWYGSCIVRYDPDGKLERRIWIPAKQTSSLTFGGPDLTDIYVTSAGLSEPMPVMPPGYDPDSGHFGGELFRVNLGIPGKPEFKCKIRGAG